MQVDELALMERIIQEKIRESNVWREKRTSLINDAVTAAKRKIESEQEAKYVATKQALLTRILKEYRSLLNESSELRAYLAVRPERAMLFRSAEEAARTVRPKPPPRSTNPNIAFEEDHQSIVVQLKEAGVNLSTTVVWSDGVLFYRERLLMPGQTVGVVRRDGGPITQMKILKISKTEMQLADPASEFPLFVSPHDLETRKIGFVK